MSESREIILKKAFNLFLQKSFRDVTMKEIVNATGLSKGAFYHYFESKEQLYYEIIDKYYLESLVTDFKKFSNDSLWNFYHDYIDFISKAISNFLKELNKSHSEMNIDFITIMFEALRIFPGFRDRLIKMQSDELKAWTKIVRAARKNGEFSSPMTNEQIARFFIYTNDGIALRLLLEGNIEKTKSEMLKLWDNFYTELKD